MTNIPALARSQGCLLAAWLIALTALLSTLYASQVLHMPVCPLCWYQRICIYPLALLLGIATFRNDSSIHYYAIPLAALGALLAALHYVEQHRPQLFSLPVCSAAPHHRCDIIHLQLFGFITFPLLSLAACLSIIALLMLAQYRKI